MKAKYRIDSMTHTIGEFATMKEARKELGEIVKFCKNETRGIRLVSVRHGNNDIELKVGSRQGFHTFNRFIINTL